MPLSSIVMSVTPAVPAVVRPVGRDPTTGVSSVLILVLRFLAVKRASSERVPDEPGADSTRLCVPSPPRTPAAPPLLPADRPEPSLGLVVRRIAPHRFAVRLGG